MRMTPELSFAAAEPASSVSSNRRSDAAISSAFFAVDPWQNADSGQRWATLDLTPSRSPRTRQNDYFADRPHRNDTRATPTRR